MSHPRDSAPQREQLENKLKSLLMNFLYKQYLLKKSDDEVMRAIAEKDLQRMTRQEWWAIKDYFRQRELATPSAMASIKRKIGMAA